MDRKTYDRGVVDLLGGLICGAILSAIRHFSMMAYFVISGIAIALILIITAVDSNAFGFGNDEQGNFNGWVAMARIIIISIGLIIGRLAISMLFWS